MLGKLLKRFFGGRNAARPVNPPPPPIPRPTPVAAAPPPPPPAPAPALAAPTPVVADTSAVEETPARGVTPSAAAPLASSRTITDPGRVRFVLEDGSLAEPEIDPELEERLRYLVDNIVPPTDPPTT